MTRFGVTLPFEGLPLFDHREPLERLCDAGYEEISTGEVNGLDALTPLILFSGWQPQLLLSCGIVSAFTRGPGILACTAAAMGEAAPGRARFGIGAGSDRIVEEWNGIPFVKPYSRVADTLRFLRRTLSDGRPDDAVAARLHSSGFRLARIPPTPPRLVVAALGPRMQCLAKAEADGVIWNFLSPSDIEAIVAHTSATERLAEGPLETEARVFVIPGADGGAELAARRHSAAYLTVPVYTNFQRWLGRAAAVDPLVSAWEAGDRRRAVELVPDTLIDELFVTGSAAACAAGLRRYAEAGADVVTVLLLPPFGTEFGVDAQLEFLCDLAAHL